MSNTPVMTAKQAKSALSARKIKKKAEKNVLQSPYTSTFKPSASSSESEEIISAINKLPRLLPPKKAIAWSTIKDVPKAERKAFRHTINPPLPANTEIRKSIVFGINKVTEALENNKLKVVLLSNDIKPFFMVHQIIDLCVLNHIPVLVVENLRDTLESVLGIASTTFGIFKSEAYDKQISEIIDIVVNISNSQPNYQPPVDHTFTNAVNICGVKTKRRKKPKVKKVEPVSSESRCLHLKRNDPSVRIFTPANNDERQQRQKEFNQDYIAFVKTTNQRPDNALLNMQVKQLKRLAPKMMGVEWVERKEAYKRKKGNHAY